MSDVKRVLCIISAMNTGGAETFLMKIYRKLDRSKYQMDFCVNISEKGFYDDEIKSLGGKIYNIPCKLDDIKQFKKGLANIIQNNQYKYVFRITSNAMGFYDLKIAKNNGAERCIVRSSNSSDGTDLKFRIAHILGQLLYSRYIDVKIAPSDLAARYTFGDRAYQSGDVSLLHNAVDLKEYSYSVQERKIIRNEFNIPENMLVIGHIGRFSEQKNHKYLLQILKKILEEVPDVKLILVGKGELEDNIQTMARKLGIFNNIIFAGIRSDISSILCAMDVFVFPSLYEGMPNTVIEAQATGLPCVISDTITKEADITGLVKYESLSKSPEEWARDIIAYAGKERKSTKESFIKNGYNIESVVREFEKLIFG